MMMTAMPPLHAAEGQNRAAADAANAFDGEFLSLCIGDRTALDAAATALALEPRSR